MRQIERQVDQQIFDMMRNAISPAFRVVCDETTNTPDVVARNELRATIFLDERAAAKGVLDELRRRSKSL